MDTNQIDFIKTIKKALNRPSAMADQSQLFGTRPDNLENRLKTCINKKDEARKALLKILIEQAELVNCRIIPVKDPAQAGLAIKKLVQSTEPEWGKEKSVIAWDHPLLEQLNLEQTLGKTDVNFFITRTSGRIDSTQRKEIRTKLIRSYIGITSADYCIAQSATLVLRTRPGQPRAVSLVPSIHVAVITLDQIIENLEELYFRLKWDPEEKKQGLTNCMTLISGPSKTADIELVMVHGAHGPRQLIIYVITD